MGKTLPSNMILAKNKLSSDDPWVVLIDVVLKDETGATKATYRFCNNNEDITYNSNTYTAFPFNVTPTKTTAQGEIPTVTLTISNATQAIQQWLEELDGGVGSEVTLYVVLKEDAVITGDSELEMEFEVLGTECTIQWINFTLGAPNPLRQRYPLYRYMANHCMWDFKGDECGYAGGETSCEKTFEACEGYSNTSKFGGFPGLQPSGIRLV